MVKRQLPAVVGNQKHIIGGGIHHLVSDTLRAVGKPFYHLFLSLRWFQNDVVIMRLRHRQIQHIRCLNVRRFLEHRHEFREVVELGKPRFCPVAGTLRGELNRSNCLAKGRSPGVKVDQVILF